MNIIYRIKYPKIFKKDVNVKELDIEEKSVYIYRIFEEQLDYRIIFDIIDSFPKNVQSNLARNIILYGSIYNNFREFSNNLICKYFNEEDLKEFVFRYNVSPFTWFANVAFEILCDKLSKEEIEFLLRVPFNKNSHQQLKILVDKGIDIEYIFEGDEFNENLLQEYFRLISPEKRFQMILNYKNIKSDYLYNMINLEDRLYLQIFTNNDRYIFRDNSDMETLKKFFLKYYKDIINRKNESVKKILRFFDANDVLKIIKELNLDSSIKNELVNLFETNKSKYDFLYSYSSLEFRKYILNLNKEELKELINSKTRSINLEIESLPKEKQIEILNINKNLIVFASSSVINDYLNNKENNINNGILLDMFFYKKITIDKLYQNYKFSNERDYKEFLERFRIIDNDDWLNVINNIAIKLMKINSNYKLEILKANISEILNKYPNIIHILSFKYINDEDLLLLHDFCKDNKHYLYERIRVVRDDSYYKDDLIRYLELASIDEINNLDYVALKNINKYLLSGDIPKKMLEKIYASKKVIDHFAYPDEKNAKQYINLLNRIDDKGRLKTLYEQINKNNYLKAVNNGMNDNYDVSVSNTQYRFLKNAITINRNMEDIFNLYKNNPNLLFTFNYELLNILDMEDILFFSKYVSLTKIKIDELLEHKNIIKEYVNYIKNNLNNNKEEIYNILCFFSKMDNKSQKEYFEKFNINDTLYFIHEKPLFTSDKIYVDLLMKIKNDEKEKKYRALINENVSKEELLDIICIKLIGLSYESAKNILSEFFDDLDDLLKDNNLLSKDEYVYIERLYKLKYLFSIEDVQILKNEYISKYQSLGNFEYIQSIKIKESLRKLYNREKIDKIYRPQDNDLIKKINGINIYELPNEFNLLLSVIGAYVKGSKLKSHPYEQWNDYAKNINQNICTSLINQSNLSFARQNDSIIFGFYDIKNDEIVKEAPYDLVSNSNSVKIFTSNAGRCMTIKNIIAHTRTGHNELLLKRNIITGKRQPDYIIAVDKIRPKDIKAAKEFNIPIVVINTLKITKYNLKKMKDIIKGLEENIDISKLNELIILFNNNYAGLITLDKVIINKYYKPLNMEKFLMDYAKKITSIGNNEMVSQYIEILKNEKNKYVNVTKEYLPYTFDLIIDYLENYLKNDKNDRMEMNCNIKNNK